MVKSEPEDFNYDSSDRNLARDGAGLPARVAIFGDRAGIRRQIAEDLAGAGFRTLDGGDLGVLLAGPIALLGDVVLVDCPLVDAATLAALARLDMRAARAGAQLIVSTSLDALDDVFDALDQSSPQILVQPSRAERVVAVGRVMRTVANRRVREMTEDDRLALLRLSQQVEAIAQQLDRISADGLAEPRRLADSRRDWRGPGDGGAPGTLGGKSVRPPLPDPRLVRQIIVRRQARSKFFDAELFSDPAWDMLLDLTAAHAEHTRVSVTSLCIAAGVPATTALRWIKQLVDTGVFERIADSSDKRRTFIALSDRSVDAMARYFAAIEMPLAVAA
ncbi:MarR family transcriptional regulator [Erythrobacter sp. JK5]|uniref:MarR family transcriptional regulator n=1 Tax=Erythrobacter sp. JK5 TaxID=2829500 RepID=UPI001BAA62B7|nr:MarR family transcriptional regulator [Erythrobacter sp. JK5]QUL36501.1 MarR family transcriptional regulator [Erythrobacter sp. JK5]